MNPPLALRQQLAQISDIQATLDVLRTDISLRLKEAQRCMDAADTAATEGATGISRSFGYSSESW